MSWKNIFLMVMLSFVSSSLLSVVIFADQSEIEREIIVKFKPNIIQMPVGKNDAELSEVVITSNKVSSVFSQYNPQLISKGFPNYNPADSIAISPTGEIVRKPDWSEIYKIRLSDGGNRETLISDLDTLPEVIYAEPNGTVEFVSEVLPNDQYFGLQWGLRNTGQSGGTPGADIHATEAWEIFTGSSNVKIGIIDAGVWRSHPDLSGKVSGDFNYSDPHGTHVAGIASAITNNSIGVAGVDWNAQIIAKDIHYSDLPGIATKIVEAADQGADVLNNSWRLTEGYSTTVRNAFAYAYKMNRVAVASMGNEYEQGNPTNYPAAFGQGMIAVGAINDNDARSYYSCTGNHIDIVAPGGINPYPNNNEHDIYSTWVTGYRYLAGTSMAAPFVSGLGSLLKGYNPDLYNDDIEQIIRISADTVDWMGGQEWTSEYGDGRINAWKALNLLRPPNYLAHWAASGESYVAEVSDFYHTMFYSIPGLLDGLYYVKRHDVRQNISFPQPFSSLPYVWGRGVATQGYSSESPNFGMGYCKVVDGSLTSTGGILESYVYAVYTPIIPIFIGWFPCEPNEVSFAYTALGQPILVAPTLSASLVQGDSNHYFHLTWNEDYIGADRYELQRESWYVYYWGTVAILPDSCHSFDYTPLFGSEGYNFRVRAIRIAGEDTIYSEWSNIASLLNVPNPPTNVNIAFRKICGWPTPSKVTPGTNHDPYLLPDSVIVSQSLSEDPSNPFYAPEPEPEPPCFPSNKVYVSWSPPGDQLEPIDYYKIRIQTLIGDSTAVFWSGPIYTLKDSLCLWPNWEYWISVVAYVGELHSDEMANARHCSTGSQICDDYSHGGSPPGYGKPEIPIVKTDLTPNQHSLTQNYPNPFNPSTQIRYSLSCECNVKLEVYNILGKKVRTLVDEYQPAGDKVVTWDGKAENGNDIASGVYFYRIQVENQVETRKMVLLR